MIVSYKKWDYPHDYCYL